MSRILLCNILFRLYKDFIRFMWLLTNIHPISFIDIGSQICDPEHQKNMMTSSNGKISRVTGPLSGEFTGNRWIPRTKASNEEFWCFLWSAPE